ncbi:MAG TPA: hypothetical protein DCS93_20745 [Microscillaceae bacterium]|nr:hypothetical protein [Microscillaceae bacterium]
MSLSRKNFLLCFFIVLISSKVSSLQAQKILFLEDQHEVISLSPYLSYYLDTTHQSILEDIQRPTIQKQFTLNTQPTLHLGKGKKTVWLKFEVQVQKTGKYLVEFRNIPIEEVQLYHQEEGDKAYKMIDKVGDKVPFDQRKFKVTNYLFEVALNAGKTYTLYLRCYSKELLPLPMSIGSYQAFLEHNQPKDIIIGAFYGIMLMMIFYNFFIFVSTQDLSYLYYILYVAAGLMSAATIKGHSLQFLLGDQVALNDLISLCFGFFSLFVLLFAQSFLNVKKYYPKALIIFKVCYAFAIVTIITDFFNNALAITMTQVLLPFGVVFVIVLGFMVYRKGYKPASFYLFGWLGMMFSSVMLAVSNAGLLPFGSFDYYLLESGLTVETLLFSLALADRINFYRREKEQVQLENVRIIQEQKAHLENEVRKRTSEIEHQKEEITQQAEELRTNNEKLAELTNFREELSHMLIHDAKQPLSPLINFDDPGVRKAAGQVLDMLENVLEVQKFENNEVVLANMAIVIGDLIAVAINQMRHLADEKLITIKNNIPLHLVIEVDQGYITRVFTNLLSNAIKYTPTHSIIKLESELLSEQGFLKIWVKDNGNGVPDAYKETIFEKFGRVDKLDRRSTGLGLAFCKLAIEAHNGEIGVLSIAEIEEIGEQGAWFYFTVPLAKADEPLQSIIKPLPILKDHKEDLIRPQFTPQDLQLIKPYIPQLEKIAFYDAGEIMMLFQDRDWKGSPALEAWIDRIPFADSESHYQQLLEFLK